MIDLKVEKNGDFNLQKIICNQSEVYNQIDMLEAFWLESFLIRVGVPAILIKKRKSDQTSNSDWTDYLFNEFGITIGKNLQTRKLTIYKYNKLKDVNSVVGEWNKPEIIIKFHSLKEKNKKIKHCELAISQWTHF